MGLGAAQLGEVQGEGAGLREENDTAVWRGRGEGLRAALPSKGISSPALDSNSISLS